MEPYIYIDGKFYPKSKARISVFDHGFLYGDGVFEGIRAYEGLVFRLREHIDRLYESAHTIMLAIPVSKKGMEKAIVDSLRKNKLTSAYIRVVVSRGPGDLGLDPRKCAKASIIIIADRIKLYSEALYEKGLGIVTVATSRNLPEALNPQIKSLNYLNNILAKIEAINAGYEEALLLNAQGYVTECTGENVFAVKNGVLSTPPTYVGILKGITRDSVMEIARNQGVTVKEEVLTRHDLYNADEVFLTGTAAEIIPIVKIDNRIIGRGKPGVLTLRLREAYHELTRVDGVRYAL